MTDPLTELALLYDTDKGPSTARRTGHNYTPIYHHLFGERREQVKQVLEIGVLFGGSVKMWSDYFPNAQIWGVDLNLKNFVYGPKDFPRVLLIEADATDYGLPKKLRGISGSVQFDLIIDDGSHRSQDVVGAFMNLRPLLAKKGVYAIEDVNAGHSKNPLQNGLWLMWNE